MRKRKRFNSEQQILDEIERIGSESSTLMTHGLKSEAEAKACLRDESRASEHADAAAVLEMALKTISRAERLKNKLPKLGEKLSEIRTATMEFVKDCGVPR